MGSLTRRPSRRMPRRTRSGSTPPGSTNIVCRHMRGAFPDPGAYLDFPRRELFSRIGMRGAPWPRTPPAPSSGPPSCTPRRGTRRVSACSASTTGSGRGGASCRRAGWPTSPRRRPTAAQGRIRRILLAQPRGRRRSLHPPVPDAPGGPLLRQWPPGPGRHRRAVPAPGRRTPRGELGRSMGRGGIPPAVLDALPR